MTTSLTSRSVPKNRKLSRFPQNWNWLVIHEVLHISCPSLFCLWNILTNLIMIPVANKVLSYISFKISTEDVANSVWASSSKFSINTFYSPVSCVTLLPPSFCLCLCLLSLVSGHTSALMSACRSHLLLLTRGWAACSSHPWALTLSDPWGRGWWCCCF